MNREEFIEAFAQLSAEEQEKLIAKLEKLPTEKARHEFLGITDAVEDEQEQETQAEEKETTPHTKEIHDQKLSEDVSKSKAEEKEFKDNLTDEEKEQAYDKINEQITEKGIKNIVNNVPVGVAQTADFAYNVAQLPTAIVRKALGKKKWRPHFEEHVRELVNKPKEKDSLLDKGLQLFTPVGIAGGVGKLKNLSGIAKVNTIQKSASMPTKVVKELGKAINPYDASKASVLGTTGSFIGNDILNSPELGVALSLGLSNKGVTKNRGILAKNRYDLENIKRAKDLGLDLKDLSKIDVLNSAKYRTSSFKDANKEFSNNQLGKIGNTRLKTIEEIKDALSDSKIWNKRKQAMEELRDVDFDISSGANKPLEDLKKLYKDKPHYTKHLLDDETLDYLKKSGLDINYDLNKGDFVFKTYRNPEMTKNIMDKIGKAKYETPDKLTYEAKNKLQNIYSNLGEVLDANLKPAMSKKDFEKLQEIKEAYAISKNKSKGHTSIEDIFNKAYEKNKFDFNKLKTSEKENLNKLLATDYIQDTVKTNPLKNFEIEEVFLQNKTPKVKSNTAQQAEHYGKKLPILKHFYNVNPGAIELSDKEIKNIKDLLAGKTKSKFNNRGEFDFYNKNLPILKLRLDRD